MGDLIDGPRERQLAPAVVTVWRVVVATVAVPLAVVAIGVALTVGQPWTWLVALGVTVAAGVAVGWLPRATYDRFRWDVDDGVLRIEQGILFRSQASVPAFRIQHIDLTQGPVDRWAGIQHLVVHTAAPGADLELPGIAVDDAPRLRAELLAIAGDAPSAADEPGVVDAV